MCDNWKLTRTAIDRREFLVWSTAGATMMGVVVASSIVGGTEQMEKTMSADELRIKLLECLGGPWPEPSDLKPQRHDATRKNGYRIETVSYEVEPGDRVPALLLVPDGVDANQSHNVPDTRWVYIEVREWRTCVCQGKPNATQPYRPPKLSLQYTTRSNIACLQWKLSPSRHRIRQSAP